jgi:hypothetical protein
MTINTTINQAIEQDDVAGYLTADYGYALVLDAADTRQTILVAPGFSFGLGGRLVTPPARPIVSGYAGFLVLSDPSLRGG